MGDSKVNDILVFMSVATTGNFASAGRAFGLSRSTAGKAVARLEDRYGVRLLNRTTRAVSLTEAGQRLFAQGKAIQAAIAEADACLGTTDGIPRGTLRITAPDALGRRIIVPVIATFQKTWPDIRFEISFSDTVSRIIEDGFDLAVRVGVTTPDASLISRTLTVEKTVLCASPAYLADRDAPRNLDQLSTHDLLQFSSVAKRQAWSLQDPSSFPGNVSGRVPLRTDSAEGLRAAALAGMGIALLPMALVKDDLHAGRLLRVLPDVDCGEVPIIALYPHKKFLEPRVRRFIDALVSELATPGADVALD
ncbi:LysR family transcriptional regulator [Paracoccus sp. 1_MG-2023]|uniref:LysR family transcriptional regulator n=1 Tax=unclassified Paracoccus (in: a-proteobacteria) TaxID=2688777 RepID=UPI001C0A07FD|nr:MULTISPECIES: LysR family transcriptional regulator [unclassified Paracoccus (in: a-proteobacteria)]MBU2958040.1 LysR family transcriptional regulator [Paracoccus sp. C2R09]MDO6670312.1 LysR family transcriptional regulator [Paracoccus sp. 1_MG-2023]